MQELVLLLMLGALAGLLVMQRRAAPRVATPRPAPPPPPRPAARPAPPPPVRTAPAPQPVIPGLHKPPAPRPERRRHPRVTTRASIRIAPFGGQSLVAEGTDVSISGMRFQVAGARIVVGELLRLTFQLDDEAIEAVGRVVRSRKLDANSSQIAVEFVRIDPWARRLIERILEASV